MKLLQVFGYFGFYEKPHEAKDAYIYAYIYTYILVVHIQSGSVDKGDPL